MNSLEIGYLEFRWNFRFQLVAPNRYSLHVVGAPQSEGGTAYCTHLSRLLGGPTTQFFWGSQPCCVVAYSLRDIESHPGPKPTVKPFYIHALNPTHSPNTLIHQSNPPNPPHPYSTKPTHRLHSWPNTTYTSRITSDVNADSTLWLSYTDIPTRVPNNAHHQPTSPDITTIWCCLPTPMTLASGGSLMFPLVVHQPASPSIRAVQSLRQGLSTNQGVTMWCVCGCS